MLSKNVAKLSGCNMGHAVAARLFLPRGVPSIRAKALSRTKISFRCFEHRLLCQRGLRTKTLEISR